MLKDTDAIEIGTTKAVNAISNKDIPSIPSLNLTNPLIQFFCSTN